MKVRFISSPAQVAGHARGRRMPAGLTGEPTAALLFSFEDGEYIAFTSDAAPSERKTKYWISPDDAEEIFARSKPASNPDEPEETETYYVDAYEFLFEKNRCRVRNPF